MTKLAGVITGRIADRPVAELFQWLHDEGQTGVARFRTALGSATVWIREGEIIDADMGRFHMEAAVLRMLKIQDGEFEIEFEEVSRRQVIRSSTAQLLAEGRKRAPRPGARRTEGLATSKPSSGQYSHVRDDSQPRNRRAQRVSPRTDSPTPGRPSGRHAGSTTDTNTHTAVRPAPRTPSPADTDAHTVVGGRSRVAEEAQAAAGPPRSRGRRRAPVASWHPTAGGPGQSDAPPSAASPPAKARSAPPVTPAPVIAPPDEPVRGRTQFMFGVARPATKLEPRKPTAPKRPPIEPEPPAAPPTIAPPVGSPTAAVDEDTLESRSHSEPRKRRARQPSRPQIPFEPETVDKTLMRIGPIPPPPGQSVPAAVSSPIPIDAEASGRAAVPSSGPFPTVPVAPQLTTSRSHVVGGQVDATEPETTPRATPFGAPQAVDEEISHAIVGVPSITDVGPGGTFLLTKKKRDALVDKPLPDDPAAEATAVIDSRRVIAQAAAAKAGGTAQVGRYEVLLRLARGGMGTVYLCRVTGEGGFRRLFALKVVRDHLNTNQAYVKMLLEEARIASRLNHPNIVSIIDIDTFAGQHYVVMDYVEGCTFSELLKAHPKIRPPEMVVPIVLDALTGLHAAHINRGDDGGVQPVVHCDFSPQNMLVGINGTCRIIDFGIAKAANALSRGPGRGKPGYLSPEQVRGLPLDPRSDIFSAGVVLWNALTGEQLFEGESPEHVLHQVVSRKIPRPSSVGLRPPACFDRICLRALDRDPDRRYQSAEQMLTDLRKVAIAEDLLAPSSEIGRWVQDSFGAQIELRRQTAGLSPSPAAAAALAVRDPGPSGHADGLPADVSATVHDPAASQTMMIQSDPAAEAPQDEEGLGPRTRVVVLLAAAAFAIAAVLTLFIRPDLLQGGIIDENGEYVEIAPPLPDEQTQDSTGPAAAAGDDPSTGTPTVAGTTGGDTDQTDTDQADTDQADTDQADTDDDPTAVQPPGPKGKGKPGRTKGKGKGKSGDTKSDGDESGKGKSGKGKSGKGKPGKGKSGDTKSDGSDAPPPDLDEIFGQGG